MIFNKEMFMAARNGDGAGERPEKEVPIEPVIAQSDADLRRRIAELEAELAISQSSEAKAQAALAETAAAAQNALLFNAAVEEVWAGKNEGGGDMWKFKIDLSPSGGTEIRLNGMPFYHGEVYTFDTATLRTIKEIVQRTWDHEKNIRGNNENVYRREMNTTLHGRGR